MPQSQGTNAAIAGNKCHYRREQLPQSLGTNATIGRNMTEFTNNNNVLLIRQIFIKLNNIVFLINDVIVTFLVFNEKYYKFIFTEVEEYKSNFGYC